MPQAEINNADIKKNKIVEVRLKLNIVFTINYFYCDAIIFKRIACKLNKIRFSTLTLFILVV